MRRRSHARAGMTLIELVVALTITGLVMASGYAAFSTMADRRAAATRSMDEVERAAAVRSTLAEWLTSSELTIEDDDVVFRGLDGVHDGLPDDELWFRTNAATGISSGSSKVRLFIERNDSTPERGLVASVEFGPTRARRLVELETRATSLDVRYLSGLHGTRDWGTSWVSTTVLPLAVDVRLGGGPSDSLPPLLRLPLLVALEGAR
jgi:prepilin-type N-terminal cleavage/methylation domain-containing protein